MSTRSEQEEGSLSTKEELKKDDTTSMTSKMSRMSFEFAGHSVDRSMCLDRKVLGYKTRTVTEPIYEDELIKNMTIEKFYEVANTNPNRIFIPIIVCLQGHNRYELCTHIESDCSVYFRKDLYFQNLYDKNKESFTSKNSLIA